MYECNLWLLSPSSRVKAIISKKLGVVHWQAMVMAVCSYGDQLYGEDDPCPEAGIVPTSVLGLPLPRLSQMWLVILLRSYPLSSSEGNHCSESGIVPMDEGRERDKTSRGGGLPTLPGLHLNTIQPSQRGFFWVHMCVWRERKPEAEFLNFLGPQPSIPWNWFLKGTVALYVFFAHSILSI